MSDLHMEFGKIQRAEFGYGGYQNCQIVFEIQVGGPAWGAAMIYECGWGHVEMPSSDSKWTHDERIKRTGEKAWEVFQLIRKAKKKTLSDLVGTPIKAYFEYQSNSTLPGRIHHIEIFEDVI